MKTPVSSLFLNTWPRPELDHEHLTTNRDMLTWLRLEHLTLQTVSTWTLDQNLFRTLPTTTISIQLTTYDHNINFDYHMDGTPLTLLLF